MFKNRGKKILFGSALCLIMLFGTSAIALAAHQFEVIVSTCYVRSGPGTGYSIVGHMHDGDVMWMDPTGDRTYANGYYWMKEYRSGGPNGWVKENEVDNISK
ncbi:MAG TPA: hypothetical protein VN426_10990 [Syntrophomonadaceae bacterium]|nr:hypothetical protein [Syntrophomonadaceae bacterium]